METHQQSMGFKTEMSPPISGRSVIDQIQQDTTYIYTAAGNCSEQSCTLREYSSVTGLWTIHSLIWSLLTLWQPLAQVYAPKSLCENETHRGNPCNDPQGFPTELTPRVIRCCIVRILEECMLSGVNVCGPIDNK